MTENFIGRSDEHVKNSHSRNDDAIPAKTIFCDIDGTLIKHSGDIITQCTNEKMELLENTLDAVRNWVKNGYFIILTTGRKESMREITKKQLDKIGIVYDQLIMGIGPGDRILINDKKEKSDRNTAYVVNVIRNKGLHDYDFKKKYVVISDEQPKEVIKPWGKEELIEYNDKYVVKKLYMKAGECCSLQYHELKKETIYVLSGKLMLYIGNDINKLDQKIILSGDNITISPYTIHRMEGIEDSVYLETSTNELYDVIRLDDKYNRKKSAGEYK